VRAEAPCLAKRLSASISNLNIIATSPISPPATASHALLTPTAIGPSRATVVRALYTYITLPRNRGGLELSPRSEEYPHLELVLSPHSPQFRRGWIKKLIGSLSWGYSDGDITQIGALVSPEFLSSSSSW
jgi:hypothetical protein